MVKVIDLGLAKPDDPIYKEGAQIYAPFPKALLGSTPDATASDQQPSKRRGKKRRKR